MSKTSNSLSSPAFSTSGDSASPAGSSTSKLALIQRILLKRWQLVLAGFVVCAIVGAGVGMAFGRDEYLSQGILRYNPLPLTETQKRIYSQPAFDGLANDEFVKSTQNLERLAQLQGLPIPPEVFRRFITLKKPYNESTIVVSFQWPNPEQGAAIVNTLMEVYVDRVVADRKDYVDNALKNAGKSIERNKIELEKAEKAYYAFADKASVSNVAKELEAVKAAIAAEENPLSAAKIELASLQKKMVSVQDKIELEKKKAKDEGQKASQVRIAQMQRELTKEEGTLEDGKSDLRKAEADLLSAEKGSVAALELAGKREDVLKLRKRVANLKDSVKQLKQAMEVERENPSTPQVAEAQRELEVMRRDEEGIKVRIQELQKKTNGLQQDARKLTALQKEAAPLEKRLEAAGTALKDNRAEEEAARNLSEANHREFKIEPALPSHTPAANTAKKYALPAFAVPFLLFLGFVVVRDLRSTEWQAEMLAGQLNLPVLGRCTREIGGRIKIDPAEARGLALRLRQYVASAGGSVLISSINDGTELDDLLANMGRFLAMRDERVLIIDARISRSEPAALVRQVERPVEVISGAGHGSSNAGPGLSGLVQYLVFEGHDLKDFIHPTGLGAVDFLPAGGPYPLTDVLASEPMKELLERLRKEYSVVLIAGPPLTQTTDTEILAAYVQGMIVLVNGAPSGAVPLNEFFQSLRDANAPLLGAVV